MFAWPCLVVVEGIKCQAQVFKGGILISGAFLAGPEFGCSLRSPLDGTTGLPPGNALIRSWRQEAADFQRVSGSGWTKFGTQQLSFQKELFVKRQCR